MAVTSGDCEVVTHLLITETPTSSKPKIPKDSFHLAYVIYFILGTGYLLPWNAFSTAVDYFSFLYPGASIDRTFEVVFTAIDLLFILLILVFKHKLSSAFARINMGSVIYLVALLTVPLMDAWYVKGRVGMYGGYYVTVCSVGLCGIADALIQGGMYGSAGELPERYMQALVVGNSASGVLVSILRIVTKVACSQDAQGLRKSANIYFSISITMVVLCVILNNMARRLPVIKYYNELKDEAVENDEKEKQNDPSTKLFWRSTLWEVIGTMKWYAFGVLVVYGVSWSLFPGSITEDFHSQILKDWYPILLITGFNVFDLLGKSLTSIYIIKNPKISIGGSFARLFFVPIFYCCLHGPKFLRTEVPVSILTCLLGFTNGYFTSVLMMLAPKTVQLQHAETAGIVLALFAVVGPTIASPLSYLMLI
ncbi:hypothetical protein ACH5RR_035649 [Cinchona calisaya]|uniref:Equilibrative nucleoside transporter n=1 Tax=Cinchona calisaya TaxID=153742 RepID=A0ABD2Y341_9GENT